MPKNDKETALTVADDVALSGYFNDMRRDHNNMSYWLPAITPKDGEDRILKIPKTVIVQVPDDVAEAFFMEDHDENLSRVIQFIKEDVIPRVSGAGIWPNMFIKNGGFSDKYNFSLCTPGPEALRMALNIASINYDALCFDADGITEIVVRELIPHIPSETPCIYNGMPLRPEFRVFYDFDKHQPLYIVNYWDWDYCHEAIERNRTDAIVYKEIYPYILKRYNEMKDAVMDAVAHDMESVTGLSGIWSVDVMLCEIPKTEYTEASNTLYLIDMAQGFRSAYWDPVKAGIAKDGDSIAD